MKMVISFEELIRHSSFGERAVVKLRARTAPALARAIVERSESPSTERMFLKTPRHKSLCLTREARTLSRVPCQERIPMKEPGLDGRHRDQKAPKGGEIRLKNGNALNKNLPRPIKGFSPSARVDTMRKETGKVGIESIREAAKRRR